MRKKVLNSILLVGGCCIIGFSSVFAIMSGLIKFGFFSEEQLKSPFVFVAYVETSIIIGLAYAVIKCCTKLEKENDSDKVVTGKGSAKSDSIIEIITQAYDEKRYTEVIYIGNAVSEYLWYSDRKDLRLKIGDLLLDAAKRTGDSYTQARVLIEDIGNTQIKMSGKSGVGNAINNISEGMEIAKKNGYTYLLIRGYRNYACGLVYRYANSSAKDASDLTEARKCIEEGNKLVGTLTDNWEKADSEAALCYAGYRVAQTEGKRDEAIDFLERAKKIYESFADYADKRTLAVERLKKVYRELGKMYINAADNKDIQETGCDLLVKSMDICEEDHDYNNLLRAALVVLESDFAGGDSRYASPIKRRIKAILPQIDKGNEYAKRIKELSGMK